MANRLLRLDEGAADVVVANQPHLHRQARLLRESDRRADARVGDGHDDVGSDRGFARQDPAEIGSNRVHAAAEDIAVRPGEVNVLEHTVRQRLRRERPDRPEPAIADDEELAGLDVAHVRRADQVEGARFGADDPGVTEAAEGERPEARGVTRRDQPVLGQHGERIGAANLGDRLAQRLFDRCRLRPGVEVQDDLGVAAGLKDGSIAHELVAELEGVDEVAVVAHGDLAVRAVDEEGLRVLEFAFARGRVACVPDRDVTGKRLQRLFVERFRNLPHRSRDAKLLAVGGGNAGALLAAMLERVEAKVGEIGGLRMSEDSKNTTLVFKWAWLYRQILRCSSREVTSECE